MRHIKDKNKSYNVSWNFFLTFNSVIFEKFNFYLICDIRSVLCYVICTSKWGLLSDIQKPLYRPHLSLPKIKSAVFQISAHYVLRVSRGAAEMVQCVALGPLPVALSIYWLSKKQKALWIM